MADDSTTDGDSTATGDAGQDSDQQTGTADLGDAGRKALDEERRARKAAERELAALRKASMSEQERAVAEARAAGLAEASKSAGPRLVRAELRAAAAEAGLSKEALDGFLEYADLSRFLGDDGEPDGKAIGAAVKRLGAVAPRTNFDGGARGGTAKPQNMSELIRLQAGVS
jgi:DNA-binding phage protein